MVKGIKSRNPRITYYESRCWMHIRLSFKRTFYSSCPAALCAVTILGLICFANGCGPIPGSDYELDAKSFKPKFLKMIEERTGISLPKGCRGLNLRHKGEIDPSFWAKIEIPAGSEAFIMNVEARTNTGGAVLDLASKQLAWWKPTKDSTKIERRIIHKNAFVRLIVCEEHNQTMLYVEWITE